MNTFTSCGLPWHPWPADGKCPCEPEQHIRVLSKDELDGFDKYDSSFVINSSLANWGSKWDAGWYPVNPDGTEITPPPATAPKRLSRPRVLRRRFPLARGVRPTWK